MPWGASFQTAGSCASVSGGSVVTCLSPWQREHRRGVGGLADSRPGAGCLLLSLNALRQGPENRSEARLLLAERS